MIYKSYLDSINKYFSLILFIPLLVGGMSQLINLYVISPNFVRFFSPAQAISDGILCLLNMLMSLILLMIFPFIGFRNKNERAKNYTGENNMQIELEEKNDNKSRLTYLVILLLSCYCFYFTFDVIIPHNNYKLGDENIVVVVIGFMIMIFIFSILINLIGLFNYHKYFFRRPEITKIVITSLIVSNLIAFLIVSIYANNQNKSINFKFLKEKYSFKNCSVEIKYFNDKYIFLERKCIGNSSEIIIEKIDSLFENLPSK